MPCFTLASGFVSMLVMAIDWIASRISERNWNAGLIVTPIVSQCLNFESTFSRPTTFTDSRLVMAS